MRVALQSQRCVSQKSLIYNSYCCSIIQLELIPDFSSICFAITDNCMITLKETQSFFMNNLVTVLVVSLILKFLTQVFELEAMVILKTIFNTQVNTQDLLKLKPGKTQDLLIPKTSF